MIAPLAPEMHTRCPAMVRRRIEKLERAAMAYAFKGSQPTEDRLSLQTDVQTARYNLERAVLAAMKDPKG